jgi:hypothetical protein
MIMETFFLMERKRAYGTLSFQDLFAGQGARLGGVRFMADSYKGSAGYFVPGGILVTYLYRAR